MKLQSTRSDSPVLRCGLAVALIGAASSSASAQWMVVSLQPAEAYYSNGYGVEGGQQVGSADVGPGRSAFLWSGSAASWVSLNPARSTFSEAFGVGGGQQAGYARIEGVDHASLWSGTPASWVDLNPVGSYFSYAFGAHGGQQVGYAQTDNGVHASLWNGTAASWVDLNPNVLTSSGAEAVHDGQQVGYVRGPWTDCTPAYNSHACLWSGSAASLVDLHPCYNPNAGGSEAHGTDGVQQVGGVGLYVDKSVVGHASLWSGTAGTWVDLHPAGTGQYTSSSALAVDVAQQVGIVWFDADVRHASLWSGTAASWVDLHAFLPSGFTIWSEAHGIWHDGDCTFVVGIGYNGTANREEALIWVAPSFTVSRILNVAACSGGMATFGVTATGTGPFTYQWRFKNTPIDSIANPSAATDTLVLSNVSAADEGSYDCVVSNACISVPSNAPALTVFAGGGGDGNGDGTTDGLDIQNLVSVLVSGGTPSAGYCAYDMDADGAVDMLDVPLVVNLLLGP